MKAGMEKSLVAEEGTVTLMSSQFSTLNLGVAAAASFPAPNVPGQRTFEDKSVDVTEALLTNMEKTLERYPEGVTVERFFTCFQMSFDYPFHSLEMTAVRRCERKEFGSNSFVEVIEGHPDRFAVIKSPIGTNIVFRKDKERRHQIPDIVKLFNAAWNCVKSLLRKHNYVLTLELIPVLLKYYDPPIDIENWGDPKHFIYFYAFTLHPETYLIEQKISNNKEHVLVQIDKDSEEIQQYVELQKSRIFHLDEIRMEKTAFEQLLRLRQGPWIQRDEKILEVSELVREGDMVVCLGGCVFSPTDFYVNPLMTWNALEDMQSELHATYSELNKSGHIHFGLPWNGHLEEPGLYVATPLDREWHRGKVVGKEKDGSYMVRIIDYGELEKRNLFELRYLDRKFLNMKAQGIKCSLKLGDNYTVGVGKGEMKNNQKVEVVWDHEHKRHFFNLIWNQYLAVHFKKKTLVEGLTKWEVVLHILDEHVTCITQAHVERELIKRFFGRYEVAAGEETEERELLNKTSDFVALF